jgi:hypothetical protein
MKTALPIPTQIETIDPAQPWIGCRTNPAGISRQGLHELRAVSEPFGEPSDVLRAWLRSVVDAEIARRASPDGELQESPALRLPWHEWNDNELRWSLTASYTWITGFPSASADTLRVLVEIHEACVTAAATRLYELHTAIENSRRA